MSNLSHDPGAAVPLVCTDAAAAQLFWNNVNRLGALPCADKVKALRHVGLCPFCAAKLKALEGAEGAAAEPVGSRPG